MVSTSILSAFIVIALCCSSSFGWKVWLYDRSEFRGNYTELSGETRKLRTCVNIPAEHQHLTSSINTHGGCIRVYPEENCTGRSIEVSPRTGAHYQLSLADFNNRAVSIGPCVRRQVVYPVSSFEQKFFVSSENSTETEVPVPVSQPVQGSAVSPLKKQRENRKDKGSQNRPQSTPKIL